jgi:hypothetical protein
MPDIEIISNGSKWAGQNPDPIDKLLEVLETETLDPRFAEDGVEQDLPNNRVALGGNFLRLSHAFQIHGSRKDLANVIEAIRKNLQSKEYRIAVRNMNEPSTAGYTFLTDRPHRACA